MVLGCLTFLAGVDGFVALGVCGDTIGAFFGREIDRLKKDLKTEFFILFHHLREARFIDGEAFLPAFFF
ncbi:MAG: hypothetical protein A2V86_06400 [Deltaproteobacteria bacterium RBG_16_49_23]|nr:MAG: hypothetical protein A2V86_06400 [Deltaproteobacteria bacterium RBG_16_49_23]